jgi:hypothetical protein
MMPKDVWECGLFDLITFLDGHDNRIRKQWEQSRIIAYGIHSLPYVIFGKMDDIQEMEDFMPLWFDPTPEERAKNIKMEKLKRGMVAEHQLEEFRKMGINI